MIDRRKFLSIGFIGLSSVALSSCSLTGYYDDKKHGIIDTTGTWIIKPKFGWISDSVKGLCTALLSRDDDSLRGIVDLSGRWVIEPKWKGTGGLSELDYFGAQDAESGLWGIARKDGSWQVEPYLEANKDFSAIGTFNSHTQRAKAYDAASDLWGFIDLSGEWVVEPKYLDICPYNAECDVVSVCPQEKDCLYRLMNSKQEFISDACFSYIFSGFSDDGYCDARPYKLEKPLWE